MIINHLAYYPNCPESVVLEYSSKPGFDRIFKNHWLLTMVVGTHWNWDDELKKTMNISNHPHSAPSQWFLNLLPNQALAGCMYIGLCMYVCMHTYIHTYIRTYVHCTYVHTYIHTYVRTFVRTHARKNKSIKYVHCCQELAMDDTN